MAEHKGKRGQKKTRDKQDKKSATRLHPRPGEDEDTLEEEKELLREQDDLEEEFEEVGKDSRRYEDEELKRYGYGDDGLNYSDTGEDEEPLNAASGEEEEPEADED